MNRFIFLAFTLIAFQCFSNRSCNPCDPCSADSPCEECSSCCPCPKFTPPPGPSVYAMNAPYKIPLAGCQSDVFVSASYLYFTAYEDGLTPYTQVSTSTDTNRAEFDYVDTNYKQGSLDCDYHSAFKVGLGWKTGCDNWEFTGSYLWFHHEYKDCYNFPEHFQPETNKIFPTFELLPRIFGGNIEFPTNIETKWELDLDLIDVSIAREFYVGSCLIFKAGGGLRACWIDQEIDQDINARYSSTQPNGFTDFANGFLENEIEQKTSSWGVGPRAFLDAKWLWGCGFSFIGKASASLLYTSYTLKGNESSLFYSAQTILRDQNRTACLETLDPCAVRPYLDLGLGIDWGTYLNCHSWYLDIYVGYDFMALWNQNMFRIPKTYSSNAEDEASFDILAQDLFLHGVNVSVTFLF